MAAARAKVKAILNKDSSKGELYILDDIGPSWAGMVGAQLVSQSLKELGSVGEIDLHINSNGGSVFEGFAIYNLLKNHPASITSHIDGIAASAASFLAMVGDKIVMAQNAYMMIHDPSSYLFGSADDFRKQADLLDGLKEQIADIYSARSGQKDKAFFMDMMEKESWFNATEAVASGLADEINKNKSAVLNSACDPEKIPAHIRAFLLNEPEEEPEALSLSTNTNRMDHRKNERNLLPTL